MTGSSLSWGVSLAASTFLVACATGVKLEGVGGASGDGGATSGAGGDAPMGGFDVGGSAEAGSGPGSGAGGAGGAPGPMCGDGAIEAGEACDDGNADNTDGCLTTCVLASCGDGFIHAGVEECDDGNLLGNDGCSATCTSGNTFGPVHTFEGMQSSFYITQFACSQSGGDPAGDALWFCQHFYNNASCIPTTYTATSSASGSIVMMHAGASCNNPDPAGFPIAGTVCNGGPARSARIPGRSEV